MTKVEELRLDIIQDLARLKFMEGKHKEMTWGELEHHYGYPLVDSLISAARSEGVAEGAEGGVRKERRRLKATRERYVEGVRFINDVGYYLIPLRAFRVPPASVLAPTKEPYAERLRDSVPDIINGEDVDPTPD